MRAKDYDGAKDFNLTHLDFVGYKLLMHRVNALVGGGAFDIEHYDAMVANQKEEVVALLIDAYNRSVNHTDNQRSNLSRRLFDVSEQHAESQRKSPTDIQSRGQAPDGTEIHPLSRLMDATTTSIELPKRKEPPESDEDDPKKNWVRRSDRIQKQSFLPNTEAI